MGLLLDLNPDDGLDDGGNDAALEAELLQLMGGGARSQGRKSEGKSEKHLKSRYQHRVVNTSAARTRDSIYFFCSHRIRGNDVKELVFFHNCCTLLCKMSCLCLLCVT